MLRRSTIQLLRFHFSFFLLPVYLFALSQVTAVNWTNAVIVFCILHLLVYPSSNGYNSYMDRDVTPIGGLQHPMQPTKQLFNVTIIMDVVAVGAAVVVSFVFALGILLYIIASRAYSGRNIRLKKYPVIGFLTVFIFQGAVVFFITYQAVDAEQTLNVPIIPCIISSLLLGALYPLTQIYQHEEDKKDGVHTISYLLGKRNTFIFSMMLFLAANVLMYILFMQLRQLSSFFIFLGIMCPVVLFFLYWMIRVWRDERAASFENSLKMNLLSTICTTIFFVFLVMKYH